MSPQHMAMVGMYKSANATVSKAKQVVMLYEGLIKFIQQAKTAHADNKIEERFDAAQKAIEIVMGLQAAIDFNNGGDVAHVLQSFYNDLCRDLSDMQRGAAESVYDKAMVEVRAMLESWKEVAALENNAAAPTTSPYGAQPHTPAATNAGMNAPIQA